MYKYILKRLLMMIPVLLGVTFIVFFILNLSPGDPAAMILGDQASEEALEMKREELGLNDPLLVRYGRYVVNMVQGDLGTSYKNDLSVWDQVMERFPNTAVLAVAGILVALIIGIPTGIISAKKQYSAVDNVDGALADRCFHAELLVWSSGGYCLCSESWLAAFSGYGRGWSRAA